MDSIASVVSEQSHRARAYVFMEGDAAGKGVTTGVGKTGVVGLLRAG
jgi:hypothetical protein